jgi:hypothetical protein
MMTKIPLLKPVTVAVPFHHLRNLVDVRPYRIELPPDVSQVNRLTSPVCGNLLRKEYSAFKYSGLVYKLQQTTL